jgi:hypothetical protein
MSKLKQKIQRAREKGCYAFRAHWCEPGNPWCVYVEGEWAPRGYMTKRQAVNLAYAISISKDSYLEVTFD